MSDPAAPTPTGYQRSAGGGFKWLPPSAEHLSKLLPQYEVECLLGRGGMGAVYKGRQKSLNRLVAIKILPPEVEDEDASYMERFKNEAQVMAKFIHPGIVAVHDFGETAEGQLYIVMEFVDGTDVAQMITAQGRLPPEHALAIAAHVCDALSYAHSHGVIHRDIKPANILINREGAVKVADFGLAKVDEPGTTGLTKTGMAMGTPDYVAPEALMFGTQVDARADLYAIGVMLYHMLTGEVPRGAFDLPSRRIGTDPRFDAIILKAMKMDREERYQSSSAIRQDLDAILTMPPVQAGGASSAAIPQEGSADTPVRTSQSPPQRGANQAAGKSARAPLDPSSPHSRNPKSNATMIALAATAAVLATGAFLVLNQPQADAESAPQTQNSALANEATPDAKQSGPLSPLSGPANDAKTTAQGTERTTLPAAPSTKPILVAQANTTPKLLPTESLNQNQFVGEWFGEEDPKGPRVVIYADGRVELWRNGKQDQRPNGTFWWTGWKWRMSGADLEILSGDKGIAYQTWKKTGADTVIASEKGVTVSKRRSKDLWSSVNQVPSNSPSSNTASGPPADALRHGSNNYKIFNETLSFDEAQKRCISMGGHLATITSAEEHKAIKAWAAKANVRMILGAQYDGSKWHWVTGEPWGYEGWYSGHDPAKMKPNYALVMPIGGGLMGGDPDHWPAFLCEWEGASASPAVAAQAPAAPSATPAASAPPAAPLPPELTTLQQQYDKLLVERVTGIYDAEVAKLNAGYLAGLDRVAATAQSAGELDTVLAIQEEKKLIAAKQPVPATDDAKTPEALKNLRTIFRTSLAKLDEQRTANHTALLTPYATRLKQIEADLTKAGRITDAVAVKTYREGLGTNPVPTLPAAEAVTTPATTPIKETKPASTTVSNKVKGDDRAAAEWLVAIGAEFSVNTNGRAIKPTKVDELPKAKFAITSVLLSGQSLKSKVTGDDLKKLAGLQELAFFELRDINYLADADLSFVATLPALQKLPLGICPITDDFTEYLVGSKELVDFTSNSPNLTGTKLNKLAGLRSFVRFETGSPSFNDEGAKALSEVKSIMRLSFEGCRGLTDDAIPHLSKLTALNHLQVCATSITGAGLAGLKSKVVTLDFNRLSGKTPRDTAALVGPALPSVNTLRLAQTEGFTREDIAALAHFKNLKDLSFLSIKDPGAWAGLEMLPHIESLNVDRQPFTDGEVDYLLKASGLTLLRLGNVAVTDAGLIKLAALKKLKTLQLRPASSVTDAGVAAFKKARPDVLVER